MTATRRDVFETFRPWLDAAGYTAPRLRVANALCDRIGLPANDNPPPPPTAQTPAKAPLGPLTPAIAMIGPALLAIAFPENTAAERALWVDPLRDACRRWGIDTIREVASFLANIGVESAGLTRLEENLNYSAQRMAEVWPTRFAIDPHARNLRPNALALSLAHKPEPLANHVYANRMGNGPPESGDGWRHRGFGPKQLTGKSNQSRFAAAAGIALGDVPAFVRTRAGGAMSAGWFWFDNGMDVRAATPGVEDDRRAINGGLTGVDDVRRRFDALIAAMLRLEQGKSA